MTRLETALLRRESAWSSVLATHEHVLPPGVEALTARCAAYREYGEAEAAVREGRRG